MRNFFKVLKFEYSGMVRPKSFLITTVLIAAVLLAAANLPLILGLFNRGDDATGHDYIDTGMQITGVFYDETGLYTPEVLASFLPQYNWVPVASPAMIEPGIDAGEFAVGLHLTAVATTAFAPGGSSMAHWGAYYEMGRFVAQADLLEQIGIDAETIGAVLTTVPELEVVSVGRDGGQGQVVAMGFTILLMLMVSVCGGIVAQSVGTEKTSKAMELLTISTSSNSLIFGKVFGVVLAALTQFGLMLVPAFAMLYFNLERWHEFSPVAGAIIEMIFTSNMLGLAFLFFLLSFFTYAFVFAALSSTASRPEDLGSAQSLPSMLLMFAYFAALLAPDAWLRVLSYVPFFSPLVMMARATMTEVPVIEIALSAGVSLLYVIGLGLLSAKIYRIGVMLTGNRPSIRQIFKLLRQS